MQGQNFELWQRLCQQAATEQDPDRLLGLIKEISRLLDEKEERLKRTRIVNDDNSVSDAA
jgi:hypothetical protein